MRNAYYCGQDGNPVLFTFGVVFLEDGVEEEETVLVRSPRRTLDCERAHVQMVLEAPYVNALGERGVASHFVSLSESKPNIDR